MGQLPLERVTISKPFTKVGVDFAGPLMTKCVRHKSVIYFKSYLCVFVCMTTRVIHLEITSGLEVDQFLAACSSVVSQRHVLACVYNIPIK